MVALRLRFRGPPPCGGPLGSVGFYPAFLLFCDQKRSRKVPLLPGRGARPRGYSPLGTPKGWSRNEKAKTCRSAARFLTLFRPSPIAPSGAKRNTMGVEGWLLCVKGAGCAIAQTEGLWPYEDSSMYGPGHNPSAPAGHLPLHTGGFTLGCRGSPLRRPLQPTGNKQQRLEIANRPIVECWPRAGASPSALGFLRARLRSNQSPSGALKRTSVPALLDGGARCAPPSARYRK